MVTQNLTTKGDLIEITITHSGLNSWFARQLSGDKKSTKVITINSEKKTIVIGFTNGKIIQIINFEDIEHLIVHQNEYLKGDDFDCSVALILNEEPKYIGLYSFAKSAFGKELFSKIEFNIFGKNEELKIYNQEDTALIFGL